ncbi:MAG: fumarylacetoacetate hydrolase family protein [Bdellovibrionales bacterium]|nr:fumarylacetoacetate hydrolase family protein [Bdellovibrionales bacterium]
MKFVSFSTPTQKERVGLWIQGQVYDLAQEGERANVILPKNILELLEESEKYFPLCLMLEKSIEEKKAKHEAVSEYTLLAPVPKPTSCRDAYAFRQHVETMRKNRGAEMSPEFDQFPVFYFTNHNAIVGPGNIELERDHFEKMDFELEVAIVVGKRGINIAAKDADEYIFGYTIMNDLSARQLQMEEMKLSLGPAKGKDFGTVIGPYLVTRDELESRSIASEEGQRFDMRMIAKHNGELISEGNLKSMNWTFAQILERVSYGVEIFPGDVIGSGTVGTGCYAEINGTAARKAAENKEDYEPRWLKEGDSIELEVEGLGILSNTLERKKVDYSIFEKKKV